MRAIIESIESEYRRYQQLGEGAIRQLGDAEVVAGSGGDNSVAVIVQHIAGNLKSRFTEFLTSDGEKPWRDRDDEFAPRLATRAEVLKAWEEGWGVVLPSVAALADADLARVVRIRGQALSVAEALHRSLAHTAYHVGQIVYRAKELRGASWQHLSIPPGQSQAYNQRLTGKQGPRRA